MIEISFCFHRPFFEIFHRVRYMTINVALGFLVLDHFPIVLGCRSPGVTFLQPKYLQGTHLQ